MILYPVWYRNRGIRRMANLVSPVTHSVAHLSTPLNSVLHYTPTDTVDLGPSQDDLLIKNAERMVFIDHIVEMRSELGNPKKTPWIPAKALRDYQRLNRKKLRVLTNPEAQYSNPRTFIVENYAPLQFTKRYTTSFFANYYKWANIRHTMWKTVNDLCVSQPTRQHFVKIILPVVLPAPAVLLRAEKGLDRSALSKVKGTEGLDILDVWQWLGRYRIDAPLNHLALENLDRVNLIFQHYDRWICINLGVLNSWRSNSVDFKAAVEAGIELVPHEGVDALTLQKRFLHMLVVLFESRTITETAEVMAEDDEDDEDEEELIEGKVSPKETLPDRLITKTTNLPEVTDAELSELGGGGDISFQEEQAAFLKEDLAQEVSEDNVLSDEFVDQQLQGLDALDTNLDIIEEHSEVPINLLSVGVKRRELNQGIIDKANELADAGLLSGAEYKRMLRLADTYQTLPNPYGKGTLAEHMVVTPESLKIHESVKLPPNKLVFDKSMLQSTLLEFDSRYIEEVLPKDVVNMVMSVQNAGVAVTAYEVEPVVDVLNNYEIHTIKLTPSTGASSTIRFRIPKVDPDGSYTANGVRYSLRKQRGDVPIRKVSSTRVALTSYYGKTFIDRSAKSINNYPNWLANQITSIGLDAEDSRVTDLKPSNVHNPLDETPKIYSTLAKRFRRFTAQGVEFFLEYSNRFKHFGGELVAAAEAKNLQMVVVGIKGKDLVLVDTHDTLFVQRARGLESLGTLEDLLGLDQTKAPLEVAELAVFNKTIPLGIAMAYYLGLERLIKSLNPTSFRRVQTGDRLNLVDGEYAIRFSDESLVFHRDDRVVSLLMGGFDNYHKALRNYSVYDFDRRDVYLNLLETQGIGVRYLRELDLLSDLFVDPITYDLLLDMKEPTDWLGLLLRSAQLLVTDWAPSETDMDYMRIKGYERFAGAVYSEVVRSLRVHAARRGMGGNKVEMPPNAIWQAIQEDPSKGLVEESNPIECLRNQEAVTFGGSGGRSRRSMVKRSRIFHPNDMGVISEATVDSGDVAINTFLTADPNFNSLRGTSNRYDKNVDGATRLLSSAAMVSPCSDRDDPKRVNRLRPYKVRIERQLTAGNPLELCVTTCTRKLSVIPSE